MRHRNEILKRAAALSLAVIWTSLWCVCYTDEVGWFHQRPDSTVEQALSSPSLQPTLTTVALKKLPSPTTPPVDLDVFHGFVTNHHGNLDLLSSTYPELPSVDKPALFQLFSNYRL